MTDIITPHDYEVLTHLVLNEARKKCSNELDQLASKVSARSETALRVKCSESNEVTITRRLFQPDTQDRQTRVVRADRKIKKRPRNIWNPDGGIDSRISGEVWPLRDCRGLRSLRGR